MRSDGHPLVERASATIATVEQLFREHWPTSAAVYLPGRQECRRPARCSPIRRMADTYARILREAESAGGDRVAQIERARRAWSQGFVAEAIDHFCRTQEVMDTSGERHRGVLTADDMARWQPRVEAPLTYDYGRYTVCKGGFWSQGPVMLQQLALLKRFDLDGVDPTSADFIHTVVECAKLAYADRETFYGDPDFVEGADRDAAVRRLQRRARASSSTRHGLDGAAARHHPRLRQAARHARARRQAHRRPPAPASRPSAARPGRTTRMHDPSALALDGATLDRTGAMRGDTVHFDIIDRDGNMVSATPSGGWLQSSPTIPELGFCLGTRAQQFWLEEGHPNALAPGKRPRTTLTPTMALRDGEPYLAWGTPGGDQQDQWTAQFFLRHVHAGMNLQEAIDAPAWHSEHFPSSFWPREARPGVLVVEGRLPASDHQGTAPPRPHRRGRSRLVGRPPHGRFARRPPPPRRRQSARHAGLRGGAVDHRNFAAAAASIG